jgi:hypothetical protein
MTTPEAKQRRNELKRRLEARNQHSGRRYTRLLRRVLCGFCHEFDGARCDWSAVQKHI